MSARFSYKKVCSCCGEEFKVEDIHIWKWKMPSGKKTNYYCSYKCYSKVFDSKYKASRVSRHIGIGYKTDKTLR